MLSTVVRPSSTRSISRNSGALLGRSNLRSICAGESMPASALRGADRQRQRCWRTGGCTEPHKLEYPEAANGPGYSVWNISSFCTQTWTRGTLLTTVSLTLGPLPAPGRKQHRGAQEIRCHAQINLASSLLNAVTHTLHRRKARPRARCEATSTASIRMQRPRAVPGLPSAGLFHPCADSRRGALHLQGRSQTHGGLPTG
jgi:hypothetical protein